jgi:hypothetical protein
VNMDSGWLLDDCDRCLLVEGRAARADEARAYAATLRFESNLDRLDSRIDRAYSLLEEALDTIRRIPEGDGFSGYPLEALFQAMSQLDFNAHLVTNLRKQAEDWL